MLLIHKKLDCFTYATMFNIRSNISTFAMVIQQDIVSFNDISNSNSDYVQYPTDDEDSVMCDIHDLHYYYQ